MLHQQSVLFLSRYCHNYFLKPQRRNVMLSALTALTSTATIGNYLFGKDIKLADAMDKGELHNINEDYASKANETMLNRLKKLRNSRPMEPRYEGHVPLYLHEKLLLFLSSGISSFLHPENGMNIVKLGEATAIPPFLESLKRTMLSDETGRRILRDKPYVHTSILHFDKLSKLPENSFGYTFYKWCQTEKVSPDTRAPVTYIDDPIHAFIFQRYRQCHDFYHALVNMPIIIEGEITIKALEGANMGVPMAILGAIFAPLRLKPIQRKRLREIYLPWAVKTGLNCKPLVNVYWEELLEKDVNELREELGIKMPPNLREMRKKRAEMVKSLKHKYEENPSKAN
ncbi:ubiquinone biosynthesis protein COQ4 NDAI_0C04750 [Naumovozyma dairenensis CBS 421]|uniref:4-hydroxy-3-methoxy-5-polyprenylbenzoate decarboxylase n=1 Tax=Naumovozyma dairenensis (strain ATCC 10597 / BCRC 20456 / CBS 421 / NBRC 0211 / NRRL Y-12639) TaxID=1071378 RepID=G0W8M3_NAUDC|nr:hypothetical protein NDAI_0C04750 [Naumovozyma dairenensis CBS 421]CCD24134.1 hypothetical protein NDAI_0C04750 [Naumovozyma dairenensis CBS 421]